jgi:hypothetical protein
MGSGQGPFLASALCCGPVVRASPMGLHRREGAVVSLFSPCSPSGHHRLIFGPLNLKGAIQR